MRPRPHRVAAPLLAAAILWLGGAPLAAAPPLVAPKPAPRAADRAGVPASAEVDAPPETDPLPPATPDLVAPPGFRAVEFAGDDLAHDVFCLTHDSRGRAVVSGPGFVRTLIDDDGDGVADRAKTFADRPNTGAQGMFFLGSDLLAVGDGGLLRFRDGDGDGVWDGRGKLQPNGEPVEPDRFLTFRTWGEHDVHAVRKGPDGWWYLIAGNYSEVGADFITRPASPVRTPRGGVLMRLTPDLTGGEIVADGMRNAYDFAFHPAGDVLTYDSDGEREVTLPWYRPTRALALVPGAHAGWHSRAAKRTPDDPAMPPVLCELGRGSPTGVVCYRHDAFPPELRGAAIAADWTFGRVLALPLKENGAGWTAEPVELLSGSGLAGFAPTSMSVGPDGDLYVAVGGRGTRGAVYRLIYEGGDEGNTDDEAPATDPLTGVLSARQPLSAWSRAVWEPLAAELGPAPLRSAALDRTRPAAQRVRAVEILAEKHGGLPANVLAFFADDPDPTVRSRVCWAHAVRRPGSADALALDPYLNDDHPRVRRAALEALAGLTEPGPAKIAAAVETLAARLGDEDRFVRAAAARVAGRLVLAGAGRELAALSEAANARGPVARATFAAGYLAPRPRFSAGAVRTGLDLLESDRPADVRLEGAHLIQLALGDWGRGPSAGQKGDGSAFAAYSPGVDLAPHETELNPAVPRLAKLLTRRRQGREGPAVDRELVRIAAMLAPYNSVILGELTARLTPESDPTEDLHHLFAAARLPVERSIAQTERIADALVRLDEKVAARGLNTDTNWEPRLKELYDALAAADPLLPAAIAARPDLGRPAHVALLSNIPPEALPEARAKFAAAAADPDYPWTGDVAFVLGAAPGGKALIRGQYDNPAVRGAVVMSLAADPAPADRPRFVESLNDADLSVVTAALKALAVLPPSGETPEDARAAEQVALAGLLRRLGDDDRGRGLKARAVELLRRNSGEAFGFDGNDPATHPAAVRAWGEYVADRFPGFAPADSTGATLAKLEGVDWPAGDAARGREVYEARRCAACHGGNAALGPDLAGVTGRFGRADLWTAIFHPSRDVPSRYRTELILTAGGDVLEGLVVYQSVDGVTLRDGQGRTWRVESDDILERRTGDNSLMPEGLMNDATPADLADLEAYLRGL